MTFYALTQNANDDDYVVYVTSHSTRRTAMQHAAGVSYVPAYNSNDPHFVVDGRTALGKALAALNPPWEPVEDEDCVMVERDDEELVELIDDYAAKHAESWFPAE
jgi:hypothetical protein